MMRGSSVNPERYALLGLTLLLGLVHGANAAECDYPFWYANTGPFEDSLNDKLRIGCLDANGCSSVLYARKGCAGCFDTGCTVTEETGLAFGEVRVLTETSQIGDLICSTGQVSILTGFDDLLFPKYYQFSPASSGGTRFVYGTTRGTPAKCGAYAFGTAATVDFTDTQGGSVQAVIPAYGSFVMDGLDAAADVVRVSSTADIVVGCWYNNTAIPFIPGIRDYENILPVSGDRIFGFDSQNTVGIQVNCDTLESTLASGDATCTSTDGLTNAGLFYTVTDNKFFTLDDGAINYQGPALTCIPLAGSCIAYYTVGDNDGGEGTTGFYASKFSTKFVLLHDSNTFAFASESVSTCTFTDSGGTIVDSVTTEGFSTTVRKKLLLGTHLQGTTIDCTLPVMLVAQVGDKEHNFQGFESDSIWSGRSYLPTCSPTSSPTLNPTAVPTESPTTFPSATPTKLPTTGPTTSPTKLPTSDPTASPTALPTSSPTTLPTATPTTSQPTFAPVDFPIKSPTSAPTQTTSPTAAPSSFREASRATEFETVEVVAYFVIPPFLGLMAAFLAFQVVRYRRNRRKGDAGSRNANLTNRKSRAFRQFMAQNRNSRFRMSHIKSKENLDGHLASLVSPEEFDESIGV